MKKFSHQIADFLSKMRRYFDQDATFTQLEIFDLFLEWYDQYYSFKVEGEVNFNIFCQSLFDFYKPVEDKKTRIKRYTIPAMTNEEIKQTLLKESSEESFWNKKNEKYSESLEGDEDMTGGMVVPQSGFKTHHRVFVVDESIPDDLFYKFDDDMQIHRKSLLVLENDNVVGRVILRGKNFPDIDVEMDENRDIDKIFKITDKLDRCDIENMVRFDLEGEDFEERTDRAKERLDEEKKKQNSIRRIEVNIQGEVVVV